MKVKQKIKEEPNLEVGKLKVEDIKKEDEVGETTLYNNYAWIRGTTEFFMS